VKSILQSGKFIRLTACASALAWLWPATANGQVKAYAYVANVFSNDLSVIDTETQTISGSAIPVGPTPIATAATPDGRTVLVANHGVGVNTVSVVDAATRIVTATIAVGLRPHALAITPDGSKAYVANLSGDSLSVLDLTTNTVIGSITTQGPFAVAITPDGGKAYVANFDSSSVTVIDTSTDTVSGPPVPVGAMPRNIAFSPDGRKAYVTHRFPAGVTVIDVATQSPAAPVIPVGDPAGIAIARDGSEAYVTDTVIDTVAVINLSTNTVVANIGVGLVPWTISLTPDGRYAYVVNEGSNNVTIIDLATRTPVNTVGVGSNPQPIGPFMGPNIIYAKDDGSGHVLPLTIASDAGLDSLGFNRFVNFSRGILKLTGNWSSTRNLSILRDGATIDTNGFDATVTGTLTGDGTLEKTGAGTLRLMDIGTHLGTNLSGGTLLVEGLHAPAVHITSGAVLGGSGVVGRIDARDGRVAPGSGGPGMLYAVHAAFSASSPLIIELNGPAPGTGYDRLVVSGTAQINGAALTLVPGFRPSAGQTFTILTNASGTFAGLPEGAVFAAGAQSFRITYAGGNGHDVVLVTDTPPTLGGLSDRSIVQGSVLGPVTFSVGDDLTNPSALVVTATSSNTGLLANANLVLGGSGATRTLTATPDATASGTSTIAVSVFDGLFTTQRTFTLTVVPIRTYYLAEGANNAFFRTDLLLANPTATPAPITITFLEENGSTVIETRTLAPTSRTTIHAGDIAGLESTSFSTVVASTSGVPLAVERTMWWDRSGYGAHTEKASDSTERTWYFAEGSQGFFSTYFLLVNPQSTANVAHVTYLREGEAPLVRDYALAPSSRFTIDAGSDPELVNRSFGAVVSFDQPGMAERAMYFGRDPLFTGGAASAGVAAPSTTWYLAEGATGSFFNTFALLANPNAQDVDVQITYLLDSGTTVTKLHTVAAHARLTLNVALEDDALASAAFSTTIQSSQPILVERSQYWPSPNWQESHTSAGVTAPGTRWGLAEGRVGGADHAQAYILVANPQPVVADVTVTFLRTDGTTIVKSFTIQPTSRFNIAVTGPGGMVPDLVDEAFGGLIESTQPIFVERSMYSDANGVTWAAGTNATATRLP
jgi:YVTN family beta-propeller protein